MDNTQTAPRPASAGLRAHHALGHLEASLDEIKNGIIAGNRLCHEAGFVSDALSVSDDPSDAERAKHIRVQASLMSIEVVKLASQLRALAGCSINLSGDLRESMESAA